MGYVNVDYILLLECFVPAIIAYHYAYTASAPKQPQQALQHFLPPINAFYRWCALLSVLPDSPRLFNNMSSYFAVASHHADQYAQGQIYFNVERPRCPSVAPIATGHRLKTVSIRWTHSDWQALPTVRSLHDNTAQHQVESWQAHQQHNRIWKSKSIGC